MAPTLNRSLADLGALLHLVDPTLPIGGFNHSSGLETFVQQGVVSTKASLEEYVQTQLLQNWIYNDGRIFPSHLMQWLRMILKDYVS